MRKKAVVLISLSLVFGCTESTTTSDGALSDEGVDSLDGGAEVDAGNDSGENAPDSSTPDGGAGLTLSLFNEMLSDRCPGTISSVSGSVTETWTDCANDNDVYLLAFTQLFTDPSGTTSDKPFYTFFFLANAAISWLPQAVPPNGALELFLLNPEDVTTGSDIELGPGQSSWMQTPPPPLTGVDPTTPTTKQGSGFVRFNAIPGEACGSFVGHIEAELKFPDKPEYCHGNIQVSIDFSAPWLPEDFFTKQ